VEIIHAVVLEYLKLVASDEWKYGYTPDFNDVLLQQLGKVGSVNHGRIFKRLPYATS